MRAKTRHVGDGRISWNGLPIRTHGATGPASDRHRRALGVTANAHVLDPLASDAIAFVLPLFGPEEGSHFFSLRFGPSLFGLDQDGVHFGLLFDGAFARPFVLLATAFFVDFEDLDVVLGPGVDGLLLDLGDALSEKGRAGSGLIVLPHSFLFQRCRISLLTGPSFPSVGNSSGGTTIIRRRIRSTPVSVS